MKLNFLCAAIICSTACLASEPTQNEILAVKHTTPQSISTFFLNQGPRADHLLTLGKGQTLWAQATKQLKIPGYDKPFEVDGTREISLSVFPSLGEITHVCASLHDYNVQYMGEDFTSVDLAMKGEEKQIAALTPGAILFALELMPQTRGPEETISFLKGAEEEAYNRGASKAYVYTQYEKTSTRPLTKEAQHYLDFLPLLQQNGYTLSSEAQDLTNGLQTQHWHKTLPAPLDTTTVGTFLTECPPEAEESESAALKDCFAIFLRKNDKITGGLIAQSFTNSVAVPHTHIMTFWIDPKERGCGAGTKMMSEALKYAARLGSKVVRLETLDFQAPRFYERMGFRRSQIDPKLLPLQDGTYSNIYEYRKEL